MQHKGKAAKPTIQKTTCYQRIEELGGPKHFYFEQKTSDKKSNVECYPLEGVF